jgi:nucleotide-binding universal stress UspA family protein
MQIPVMVATDGSTSGRRGSLYAVRLAKVLPLKITLVHAVRGVDRLEYRMIPDFQLEMIEDGARRHAQEVLDREAAVLEAEGLALEQRLLLQGDAGTELCAAAERAEAGLLLLGRHGHGELRERFYGSTCSHVLTHCRQPVLVVNRDAQTGPIEATEDPLRVLVALDESDASGRVLRYLEALAPQARTGMELTLSFVVHRDRPDLQYLPSATRYEALTKLRQGGEDVLAEATGRLQAAGYRVDHRVEEGSVGDTLCRLAREDRHEVVLLGRREAGEGHQRMLGAVCHYVAHHCPCHVWISP